MSDPIEDDPLYQFYSKQIKVLTNTIKRIDRRNPRLPKLRAQKTMLLEKRQSFKDSFDGKVSQYGSF